jgi:hypothetical protein
VLSDLSPLSSCQAFKGESGLWEAAQQLSLPTRARPEILGFLKAAR